LVARVRAPHETIPGGSQQEARTLATTTGSLLELRDWPTSQGDPVRDGGEFSRWGHLVSWAKLAAQRPAAGRQEQTRLYRQGQPLDRGALGESGIAAARTRTFLVSRYHRPVRRPGNQRALLALGNSILTIDCHLLSDPGARFTNLGPDWHDRLAPLRPNASSSLN
jgi:hypothetical protein